jgi:aromatic ring-opening dioxygenase catalytic subunit (LigB family)
MTGAFRRNFDLLEQSLLAMRTELDNRPTAVLVITGHWDTRGFALSSGEWPGMVYDYSGCPGELYQIHYRAPGSPRLAQRVQELLRAGGVAATLDPARGFDHGTFSIMQPVYPGEDMPIVQLSIDTGFDPALHLAVGRLLAPLRDEGVLMVGSGLSYHNLRAMMGGGGDEASRQFDAWLSQTLLDVPFAERTARLLAWEQAPSARAAHPREDHLIPLMVVAGAAEQDAGARVWHQRDFFGGITASSFRFGNPPVSIGV